MGLVKKGSTVVETPATPEITKPESGTAAAIARLQQPAPDAKTVAPVKYAKPRDFDKEAKGKTKCKMWEASLQSPAIAGMAFKNMKEYLALVREAADEGVKYSFEE
jgi:hypothetical protein